MPRRLISPPDSNRNCCVCLCAWRSFLVCAKHPATPRSPPSLLSASETLRWGHAIDASIRHPPTASASFAKSQQTLAPTAHRPRTHRAASCELQIQSPPQGIRVTMRANNDHMPSPGPARVLDCASLRTSLHEFRAPARVPRANLFRCSVLLVIHCGVRERAGCASATPRCAYLSRTATATSALEA